MKNESGLNLLSEHLKQHKSFKLFSKDEYFADFYYDEELKRYQSDWGYLSLQDVYEIAKDENDDRNIIFYN